MDVYEYSYPSVALLKQCFSLASNVHGCVYNKCGTQPGSGAEHKKKSMFSEPVYGSTVSVTVSINRPKTYTAVVMLGGTPKVKISRKQRNKLQNIVFQNEFSSNC